MSKLDSAVLVGARHRDETAIAAVIAHMMPAIRSGAAASVCPGLDFDDAVQEGIIGLFGAVQSFRAGTGASFDTYATVCIRNAQRSAQRAAGRKKHAPLNQSMPLNESQQLPGPEENILAQEAYTDTVCRLNRALSPFEKAVLALRLDGLDNAAVAQKLHRTPKAVENALVRARRKLRPVPTL